LEYPVFLSSSLIEASPLKDEIKFIEDRCNSIIIYTSEIDLFLLKQIISNSQYLDLNLKQKFSNQETQLKENLNLKRKKLYS